MVPAFRKMAQKTVEFPSVGPETEVEAGFSLEEAGKFKVGRGPVDSDACGTLRRGGRQVEVAVGNPGRKIETGFSCLKGDPSGIGDLPEKVPGGLAMREALPETCEEDRASHGRKKKDPRWRQGRETAFRKRPVGLASSGKRRKKIFYPAKS
jgi:hypothetical protein